MPITIETAPVSARREPPPEHPPYAWMIGEAIEALRGGASEEVISAFILGRHPGVPQAHDRLLRHYLAKHVAQGLFVCTAQGRYSRASNAAQVTVAKLSLDDHGRQLQPPDELALVVANHDKEDGPTMDHDQSCTMAPHTAADGTTKHMSRRRRRPTSNAAPVHSPAATSSSTANINNNNNKKHPRERKVQDLYDHRNAVPPPPKPVQLPAPNVPADNQMWCVLALPAPVRR